VVGILQLSLGWQVIRGRCSGMVARNEAISAELMKRACAYGWEQHVIGVEVLGLDVEAIADHAQWDGALDAALDRFGSSVSTVINGCSAVPVKPHGKVTVVDPTALALRLIAAEDGR
jgi:hypothetical protein